MSFRADCLATGIGSVPHSDPETACRFVWENFPQIPFWPQLPKRSFRENMYAQYCEGLPGLRMEENKERFYLDSRQAMQELEGFYERFLGEDLSSFAISPHYAGAWPVFLEMAAESPGVRALKGQVTGPISYGLQVTDENRRALLYDDNLRDVIISQISRKAQWQEQELMKLAPQTIIFVDEPYLSSFGSAFVNLSREEAIEALERVFAAVSGKSAVHCCGNTDWSLLLQTGVDILSLDAYEFADALLLYKNELKHFIKRGGIIAWGIVPTDSEKINDELLEKFKSILKKLSREISSSLDRVLEQSLITPSCGVGGGSPENALAVFAAAARFSARLRREYGFES